MKGDFVPIGWAWQANTADSKYGRVMPAMIVYPDRRMPATGYLSRRKTAEDSVPFRHPLLANRYI